MTKPLFQLDPSKPFHHQDHLGHNRWHPEIPPVETIRPGETFRVDCRDWFDGAVRNDESAEDVLTAPFHIGHPLSGPFRVEGAKPGDLLVVDIVDVAPMSGAEEPGDLAARDGGIPVSSHLPTVVVSSTSISLMPTRRSGISGMDAPPHVTSPGCLSRARPTPV